MAGTQVSMPFRMRLHWLGYTEKGSGKGLQFHHSYYFYINSKVLLEGLHFSINSKR